MEDGVRRFLAALRLDYCKFRVNGVLLVVDPLVAMTRIVCEPGVGCVVFDPPLHAVRHPSENTDRSSRHKSARRFRVSLRTRHRKNMSTGISKIPVVPLGFLAIQSR